MEDQDFSMTGVWDGRFTYPRAFGPTPFTATLLEFGSTLTGTTHEIGTAYRHKGRELLAMLEGQRRGPHVEFIKTYENAPTATARPVRYEGVVNADATEIKGTWTVHANWSGSFVMSRPKPQRREVQIERRVAEPVES